MTNAEVRGYRLISLSGGGYRAALFNAGALRALHTADLLVDYDVIVNAVSGGTIPAVIWQRYIRASPKAPAAWPENALLNLVTRTPKLGGQFNWQLRGAWFRATEAWRAFLQKWWDSLEALPDGLGYKPHFLLEALDYHSGQLWLYDENRFCPATRDFIKTRSGFRNIYVSEMTAVATATAFPIFFQGMTATDEQDPRNVVQLRDAGPIDNLAMMPLLQILRHDSSGHPLGPVKQWMLSDAGRPLAVTSGLASNNAIGNARIVRSLGALDQVFRLTGDLAQPQFVNLMAHVLVDYLNIRFVAVAIGLSVEEAQPWLPTSSGDPVPAQMSTTLGFVPKRLALTVMTEGAQAMSRGLVNAELMTIQKQQEVEKFFAELAR